MGSSYSSLSAESPTLLADRQQAHLRIHAINIFVRDQDQSLRFYLDQLGFSLVGDVRLGSGERWVAVAPPDGIDEAFAATWLPDDATDGDTKDKVHRGCRAALDRASRSA